MYTKNDRLSLKPWMPYESDFEGTLESFSYN